MAKIWKVDFEDKEGQEQTSGPFSSKEEAQKWIKTKEDQEKTDPIGFEIVDGPYLEDDGLNDAKLKLWFDAIRPAPDGFKWIRSVEAFTDDFAVEVHKDFSDVDVISFDTEDDADGHSFSDVISYFENVKAGPFRANVHGNDAKKKEDMLNRFKANGWEVLDSLFECKDNTLAKLNEMIKHIGIKSNLVSESWKPEFDDKPVNQWGERWQKLKSTDWLYSLVDGAAKDCQIDLYEDGLRLEKLNISSVHILKNRNLIVTVFGGANGDGMQGGCNLKYYLCLIRKLLEKLVGCCKPFADAWLIDWDNDCVDDIWTLRFVLKPSDETLAKIADCGYVVDQVKESTDHDECVQYINEVVDGAKIWIDDIRPAPNGYIWLKSVNEFIDWMVEHGIDDVAVIDIDYDAGDNQKDGGDYIKILDWLEFNKVENLNVRIHSANPVGVANMRRIIRKNGWTEMFDIIDEYDEQLNESILSDFSPTYRDLVDALHKLNPSTTIRAVANGHESQVSYYYGKHDLESYDIHVDGYIVFNEFTKHEIWRCLVRDVLINKAATAEILAKDIEDKAKDLSKEIDLWIGFSDFGHKELLDNDSNPTHAHKVSSFELFEDGTLKLNLVDIELHKSIDDDSNDKMLDEVELNEVEDANKKDKLVATLKKASKDFQNAASNHDPEQFSKIVVAFDDLMSGVGAYDFKAKKVLKEEDVEEQSNDVVLPKFNEGIFLKNAQTNGIDCISAKTHTFTFPRSEQLHQRLDIEGDFPDDEHGHCPMTHLKFIYKKKSDEIASKGWYQNLRCMNRWNNKIIDLLNQMYPNGIAIDEGDHIDGI